MSGEQRQGQEPAGTSAAAGERWQLVRFKWIGSVTEGQVDPEKSEFRGLPLFAPDHIESRTGRLTDYTSAAEQGAESGKYPVAPNDILYSKIRPALRKVAIAPERGLCSADVYPIKAAPSVIPRFLYYAMLGEDFSQLAVLESDRVAMPKINRESLGNIRVQVPGRSIQRAAVGFLDRKTAAIDDLIAKKQRLIELLQEKRQALITQAVTKGLDPNVPMKDSGVEWVGKIPEHWRPLRLKDLCDAQATGVWGSDPGIDETGFPVARTADVKHGYVAFDDIPLRSLTPREQRQATCSAGDIIVVKSSGSATNVVSGKVAIVRPTDPPFAVSNFLLRLRPRGGSADPWFLYFLLASSLTRQRVLRMVSTTTYPNLQVSEYMTAIVPTPPFHEQERISEALRKSTDGLAATTQALVKSTLVLHEYRQALITAAVTGKLDIPATPEGDVDGQAQRMGV